jgi:hypothetical protein
MKARRDRQQEFMQRTQSTKNFVDSLNLKGTDRVTDRVAAAVLNKHPVTLRAWRHDDRGPPFWKDPTGTSVLYKIQDLWDWTEKNTVDPAIPTCRSTSVKSICEAHRSPADLGRNDFKQENDKMEESK